MSDWIVERHRGPAADLHDSSAELVARPADGQPFDGQLAARSGASTSLRRRIRVLEATAPAIVLGRAEPDAHVDRARAAAAGVAVVRRRSGGGAVLVGPGRAVWIDLVVPVGDPLWSDDVGRAMWWVGEAWAAALGDVGRPDAAVWRGPLQRHEWSDRVCFAGLGPGEVVLPGPDGRSPKVVGVAQRRTRVGALFQCGALVEWDPHAILDVLALPAARRRAGVSDLAGVATGVGDRSGALVEAVIDRVVASGAGG